ncbi:MAG: hypothetical protein K0B02_00355 [DPANN group archaeon]|nr:hypothetical protein [DPANN group archaeon]
MKFKFFKSFFIFLILFFVLMTSGCFGIGGGQDINTQIVSTDLLKVNSLVVTPSSEIPVDGPFLVLMEIENVGQVPVTYLLDSDSAPGVSKFDGDGVLTDYCNYLYKISEFSVVPKKQCVVGFPKSCMMNIKPGEVQKLQWKLKAPSEKAIMVGEHVCDFAFYLNYTAQAITTNYIYFASNQELSERQYSDKELPLTGSNIATYGPVAINLKPAEPQPIVSDSNWTLYVTVRNFGTGLVNIGDLTITLPDVITKSELCDSELFNQVGVELRLSDTDKSKTKKVIFRDKSTDLPCVLLAPPISEVPILTPYKFVVNASYNYLISGTQRIVTYSPAYRNIVEHK